MAAEICYELNIRAEEALLRLKEALAEEDVTGPWRRFRRSGVVGRVKGRRFGLFFIASPLTRTRLVSLFSGSVEDNGTGCALKGRFGLHPAITALTCLMSAVWLLQFLFVVAATIFDTGNADLGGLVVGLTVLMLMAGGGAVIFAIGRGFVRRGEEKVLRFLDETFADVIVSHVQR